MQSLILAVVLVAVAIGTYTDLKKREVADWLNYGLAAFGLGANALYAIFVWDLTPLLYSLAGFALFFAIAYAMYYAGQWGGGDSKMLIGIGAAVGLPVSLSFPFVDFNAFLISFWFNLLLAGVVYSLAWAGFIAFRQRRKFAKEFREQLYARRLMRRVAMAVAAAIILAAVIIPDNFFTLALSVFAIVLVMTSYLSVFSKTVEKIGMLARVKPSELTEGDWIAKDIVVSKKIVAGPKDLGISKKQIKQLQRLYAGKKIRSVLIKVGIPFVPSFLAAFIVTIFYGNVFTMIFGVF